MAKKLPPEELSKTKTDFDAPKSLEQIKKNMDAMELGILENFLAGALTSEQEKSFLKRHPDLSSYASKRTTKAKTGAKKKEQKAAVAISELKPEKNAGGRQKKREEETSVRSFRLPDRTVKRLRVLAALKGVSAADIIVELADRENVPGLDK